MKQDCKCAIWGTDATCERQGGGFEFFYDSPRAAGGYFVDIQTRALLEGISTNTKARLTDWLLEQRRFGDRYPQVSKEEIDRAESARQPSVVEQANRMLLHLSESSPSFGARIDYRHAGDPQMLNQNLAQCGSRLTAADGGQSEQGLFLDHLKDQGWIALDAGTYIRVTLDGHAHLESLRTTQVESSQAFVAMWFDESMLDAWTDGIEPAIKIAGYEPLRIDRQEHNNKIDDEIIAGIRRSRFLVADFSQGNSGARGGVYYEAGFAHGLGIPVIFTCRKEDLEKVHFDTRQFNHIVWKSPEDLKEGLSQRISATIGDGPMREEQEVGC